MVSFQRCVHTAYLFYCRFLWFANISLYVSVVHKNEIPGMVAASIPYLPTEMPAVHVDKVMERHGVMHDRFICKKNVEGHMVTTGTRLYKIVVDQLNPVPPRIKVRGHESIVIYDGM